MNTNKLEQDLYEIASLQQGYFTARQAKKAGYSDSRFAYHIKQGKWIREGRGIYRLANYPVGDRPDLVYWSLWSCNRAGIVQGLFSHQTALAIHDLSDVMPAQYHLTVPRGFRRYHKPPANLVLHFANTREDELWEFEGYKVTNPEKTVEDVLLDDGISEEIAIQAILDGIQKGVISYSQLSKLVDRLKSERVTRIFSAVSDE
jgi:predicted transcriptional regulator of viral defense system